MTNSMTAFASSNGETELGELTCELRSVNHRYLEVAPRMPEELRVFESELRDTVGKHLTRGRIDCFIRLKETALAKLEPNPQVAKNLAELVKLMTEQVPDMQPLQAIDVLRWPGVLQSAEIDQKVLKKQFLALLNKSLEGLSAARAVEGDKMAELINQRLQNMQQITQQVTEFLPELAQQYRQRIEDKLGEIKDQLDPSRLEQEMVMFLQKNDVAEELDRLKVHIEEVSSVLNKDAPCGRRLDFLMQELNREANTLGSKSQDARLTKASVDLKVLIEQMREQVQNIE